MSKKDNDATFTPEPPTEPPEGPAPPLFQHGIKSPRKDCAFLRMGNICIAIDRIVSVEFLSNATLFRVGDTVFYGTASAHAEPDPKEVEPFETSVVVVSYVGSNDIKDVVRRWGDEADEIWSFVISYLASP